MFEFQAGDAGYSWRLPPPNGLVVVSVEARKEDYAVLWRSDCEGYCAHPAEATKSNTSKACH